MRQVDIARRLSADKGLVSHWYNGTTPGPIWQRRLADLFGCQCEDLFCHPDAAWFSDFLAGRSATERARIKAMLTAAFPVGAETAPSPDPGQG